MSLKSRRFGFVTFAQPWCVDKILDYAAKFNGTVKIDGFFVINIYLKNLQFN